MKKSLLEDLCIAFEPRTRRLAGAAVAPLVLALLATTFLLAGAPAAAQDFLAPAGGGGLERAAYDQPCLTDADRLRIRAMLDRNVERLRAEGNLPEKAAQGGGGVALDWPLALADGLDDPGYHGISNFVDLDAAFPDQLLDYNCGARTYDTTGGYNHRGIDYYTWPFWWFKMDHDHVEAVAAEPGTIIGKDDGNQDRSCSFNGSSWNAVYVMHSDGSEVWYGHLKNGSLTSKPVGATVAAGEFLGVVGSSGNSTNPHLHLELRDSEGILVEPYSGPCQSDQSWWSSQRPYYDSAINLLATHSEPPVFPDCPNQEIPNFSNDFLPGATVHVATYFRDIRADEIVDLRLIFPNGTTWQSWQFSFESPEHYSGAYWFWTWFMPMTPEGTWTFEVTYDGDTYSHPFRIGGQIFADGFESGDTSAWQP